MKRAAQLQPLSRQHHLGLNISRNAKECSDNPEDISKHWHKLTSYIDDLQSHFAIEDHLIATALLPYSISKPEVASALTTFNEQHKSLQALVSQAQDSANSQSHPISAAQVKALATLLYDHIRFEERDLFPIAERYLTTAELDTIYAASPDNVKRADENR
uniref:hemerythrin domain-containing protein n=1 Tax=uncultured Psychrobacter sp. TaxID=259303 RepID=UPI00260A63EC|nr:hemerythrin domain-containing protein [uncultured Psychrobacter sp.]